MTKKAGKALVLSSGGCDSTTCISLAVRDHGVENVATVSVSYGQKHSAELECAKRVADHFGVAHYEVDLSSAYKFSNSTLLQGNDDIAHESYQEQLAAMGGSGTVDTYVPFRNGLMLSYVAAVAISTDAEVIYFGAHADDAAGRAYPDCTPEFYDSMSKAIYEGSGHTTSLYAPFINQNKAGIVAVGLSLGTPYELTMSCYEGNEEACGTCGTCIDRLNAFKVNNATDPIAYKEVK